MALAWTALQIRAKGEIGNNYNKIPDSAVLKSFNVTKNDYERYNKGKIYRLIHQLNELFKLILNKSQLNLGS